MVKHNIAFIFLLLLLPDISLSQMVNPLDSIPEGIKYKITLFDEREIIGTVVSQTDRSVSVRSENILMTIERDNILSISKDISSSRFKFLATLNTGTVPNTSSYGSYSPNFIINARFSYFYSESKNIGIDLSFTSFSEQSYAYEYSYVWDGGPKETFYDVILNAQIGTFDKKNIVDIYLNLGAGVHVYHRSSYTTSYYSYYDSIYHYFDNDPYTRFYPVLQIGGGMIIKPVYNLGINIEADMQAYGFGLFYIPMEAVFPLKAGISYYFMK